MAAVKFPVYVERGCGLDVHQKTVVASIIGKDIEEQTKTFGTFSDDLYQLAGWLQNNGITHIAMESTGVYWKPVYSILEDFFKIILVNARHIKNVPGHKTDKKDSEWIAKLLMSGLLKASFIPPQPIRELRALHRHRRKLVGQRTSEKNRLQNILEDANIKLSSVISDVFGATGKAIIKALINGIVDPVQLSDLAKGSLKRKKDELKKALTGKITEHHRFMLSCIVNTINHLNDQIALLEARMETYTQSMKQDIDLLQTIPGVSAEVARGIIAEIGNDMSAFPSQANLASWAGLCPGNNETAGKKKSMKINHGNKYLKTTIVEAAWAASHSKVNPVLAIKHRSIAARRGIKKANIAIGHKILIAVYFVLKDKVPFQPSGRNEEMLKARKLKKIERLEKELNALKNTFE